MNILYIGPYRQNSLDGIHSLCILQTLLTNGLHNIVARPVYINASTPTSKLPTEVINAEKNDNQNIDCVIQHTPISFGSRVYQINKNIIIPILGSEKLSLNEQNILASFDMILLDSKLDANKLLKSNNKIQKNIKNFDYDIFSDPVNNSIYDLGIISSLKKLYFIGSAIDNADYINMLVRSFIKNNHQDNLALVLYLLDVDFKDKEYIDKKINDIYTTYYGGANKLNKVITVPIQTSLQNLIIAHNSCDILIDLHNKGSNSINLKIAQTLNKPIVSISNDLTYKSNDSNYMSHHGYLSVSEEHIDNAIKSYINSKSLQTTTSLFKTQHLNKIL
jgi:hypothetical protein